ncbi:MAG: hypothetical protein HY000_25785 [Planctomycetes bacterium]|nr:hypothetical protein [Planctomycetota bacterium]
MDVFRKDQNLIDALLPELTGEEAPAVFGHNKWVPVHKALRYMVVREFTTGVRRTDCLESMGLARVLYDGVNAQSAGVRALAEAFGVSPEETVDGISLILDNWRRNRILYVTGDPIFSHYHAKDDPYIQAGLLPLQQFRSEGLLLTTDQSNSYARGLLAQQGASAVQALLKKWAANPGTFDVDAGTTLLWQLLTEDAQILTRVTLRSQQDKPLAGDVWQVNLERLAVEHCQVRQRCTTCQRIAVRRAPSAACTRHNCHGTTVTEQPDRENYDVWLMGRPFVRRREPPVFDAGFGVG